MHTSPHAVWRKASRSGDGNNCVELAALSVGVGVRDSKNLDAGTLLLPSSAWRALADQVKAGELDLP